ncbi:argininosuccinate lyase [Paramagnetospirillum caucaseum]|uniref:argininosuccinate lyase n=1 Tax=Paramagnetospirillum caucaseum TaxID=1244869 RepID=UPI001F186570|nr:argininosuccinate lyase [Paramagnetospirillum caucaseum]
MGRLFAALLLSGIASSAIAAEAKQDFTLVNKTGYELNAVYVSPGHADAWGEDVMGQDILGDGESVHVTFKRAEKSCQWDLKVIYTEDDSSAVWHDIDLCSVSKITIRYNRKSDKTTASYE